MRSRGRVVGAVTLLLALLAASFTSLAQDGGYHDIGTPEFQDVWERTDLPVRDGTTSRTWVWGPDAFSELMQEDYVEAPDGMRTVQYFDKSRMEMPWDDSDPDSPWYITQGLLARELMTGQLQVGDDLFEQHAPSSHPAAGDPNSGLAPSYAVMGQMMGMQSGPVGSLITATVDAGGNVSEDQAKSTYDVRYSQYIDQTGHYIAAPFWELMNSTGTIFENGGMTTGPVFQSPYYSIGFPLTPALWARAEVKGVEQDVLIQCFERRCLTFTPDNEPEWQVESGNIGQHYYHWRYAEIDRDSVGASFTVTPEDETNDVGDTHELTVTVFGVDDEPKDGIDVQAEVVETTGESEAHLGVEMSGISGNDGDGVVKLRYDGEEAGTDTIRVSVNGVLESQTVSKTWADTAEPDNEDDRTRDSEDEDESPGDPATVVLAHDGADTGPVGTEHTVLATVRDGDGDHVADGTTVQFTIQGPNGGESGSAETDDGVAAFAYTGTVAGDDQIEASWDSIESNQVVRSWEAGTPARIELAHDAGDDQASTQGMAQLLSSHDDDTPQNVIHIEPHTVVGTVFDEYDNPVPETAVDFLVTGANDKSAQVSTNAEGVVRYTYTGENDGTDDIAATIAGDNTLSQTVQKIWLDLRVSLAHDGTSQNHVGTRHTVVATAEYQEHDTDTWLSYQDGALIQFGLSGAHGSTDVNALSPSTTVAVNGAFWAETDGSGDATLSYDGINTGTDDITATIMHDDQTATPVSATIQKDWFEWDISLAHDPAGDDTNPINSSHSVVATVSATGSGPTDGVDLSFSVADGGPNGGVTGTTGGNAGNSGATTGDGTLGFSYDGGATTGQDTIEVTITDARTGSATISDSLTKTWADVTFTFDEADAENPYFTNDDIADIEQLVKDHLGDGENETTALESFWTTHTGYTAPNKHSVDITVSENGTPIADGEEVVVSVVHDQGGGSEHTIIDDQSYTVGGGDGTVTIDYTAHGSGTDTITASYGIGSDSTTKTWTPYLDYDYGASATYVSLDVDDTDPTVDDSVTLTATVLDQFGQPIDGEDVTFGSNRQSIENQPDPTDDQGKAILENHNHSTAEQETITVSVSGLTDVDLTIDWQAGAATSVSLSVSPDTQTVGGTVTLSAEVTDQHGNKVPNVDVTFNTDWDSGSDIATVATGTDGAAAEIDDHSQTATGSETITASVSGLTDAQETIAWQAGAAAQIHLAHDDVEGDTSTNPVGSDHTVSATVQDQHGNTVTSFDGQVDLLVGGDVEITATAADGVASLTYSGPEQPRTDTIGAQITSETSVTEVLALTKEWVAGPGDRIHLSHASGDGERTVATTHSVNAEVVDEYGNLVGSFEGDIEFFVDGDSRTTLHTDDGDVEFTYTGPEAAGDEIVTATSGDLTSNDLTVTWVAGSADSLTLEVDESSPEILDTVDLTATLKDEYGNPIPNIEVTFESDLASTSPIGTLNTGPDGTAVIENYEYTDQSGLIETITASVADTVIGEPDNQDSVTISWWESGVAANIEMGQCDEPKQAGGGSNFYCFITAKVTDGGGTVLNGIDVEFSIDDGSWEDSSGNKVYSLRNYDDGSTTGSGNDQQQRTATSGDSIDHPDKAVVTHRARNPGDDTVIIHAKVGDGQGGVLVEKTIEIEWSEGGEVSNWDVSVEVAENPNQWAETGSLGDSDLKITGRFARLAVQVKDDEGNSLPDETVTLTHLTDNSEVGNFSGDPGDPHDDHEDGTNPITIETDSDGDAYAVFFVRGDELLPVTATIEVDAAGLASPIQGDVEFLPDAPDAPTSLTATAQGHNQIDLSWSAPADLTDKPVDEYEIERSPDGNDDWQRIDTTTDTAYQDIGLNAETTYHYRVRSVNAGGASAWSNVANATTHAAPVYTLTLAQTENTNTVGSQHTFTATLKVDDAAKDFDSENVAVTITRGGDTVEPSDLNVSVSGNVATITYTGPQSPATDTLDVTVTVDGQFVSGQSSLTKTWVAGNPNEIKLAHSQAELNNDPFDPTVSATNEVGTTHKVFVLVEDAYGNVVADGTEITFEVTDGDGQSVSLTANTATTTDGYAEFEYTGPDSARTDSIKATWGTGAGKVESDLLTKEWTVPVVGPASSYATTAISSSNGSACGATTWEHPENAADDDDDSGDSASVEIPAGDFSECLELTGFGFELPQGATVTGIELTVWRSGHGEQIQDYNLQLLKAGERVGSNRADSDDTWSSSGHGWDYGGESDLWGTPWSASDINNDGFGVSITAENTHNNQDRSADVYGVEISVHYDL